tara:strand:+ start:170 stop:895 length:726 start_codon:yes stop_codon:yes gene_type:complete
MQTGIIVQARTGSTRLPNKVLLPFYQEHCILDIIFQKLKTLSYPIVVATSSHTNDNQIIEISKRNNVQAFKGSEENVLERFIDCAKENSFSNIIRVCADNPFIDTSLIEELLDESADYSAHFFQDKPSIQTHWGVFAEFVSLTALEKIHSLTNEKTYLEHVTNYIYQNPEHFTITKMIPPILCQANDIRLTVDTHEDFKLAQTLYKLCVEKYSNFNLSTIIENITQEMKLQMTQSIAFNQK